MSINSLKKKKRTVDFIDLIISLIRNCYLQIFMVAMM